MANRIFFPKFSDAEYASRWQAIRDAMDDRSLDCLIVYGGHGSHFGNDPGQANLRYVANFIDQFQAYCVFPRDGESTVLTTYNGHIASGRDICMVPDMRFAGQMIPQRVAETLKEKGFARGRIGIVGVASDRQFSLPYEHYMVITEALPDAEFAVVTDMMEALRRIKSDEEIEFLREGARRTDRAFEAAVAAIRPGARNIDVYNAILHESIRDGGTMCFALLGSTSMTEAGMAFPDAYISDREIGTGDVVINEHSSCYGGYSGQMLRTVFVGEPTRHYRELFAIAKGVFHGVMDAIRPGATTADVMEAAQPILDAGLTVKAPLLHGWGNFSESPRMGIKGSGHPIMECTFEKGQTIVVEPNPCTPDGSTGVFLGDLCLVTENGVESLHTYPIDEPIIVDNF